MQPEDFFLKQFPKTNESIQNGEDKEVIIRHLENEIDHNNSKNIFFRGCSLGTYKKTFHKRLKEFIEDSNNPTKKAFIEKEIDKIEYWQINTKYWFNAYAQWGAHCPPDIEYIIDLKLQFLKRKFDNKKEPIHPDPLDFNLNQTDLVHFFLLLADADIIKVPSSDVHKKGGFFPKISKYFTAQGKPLNSNSMKVVEIKKEYRKTPYSESFYDALNSLKRTIDQKLKPGNR